jgi:hypothetical protein
MIDMDFETWSMMGVGYWPRIDEEYGNLLLQRDRGGGDGRWASTRYVQRRLIRHARIADSIARNMCDWRPVAPRAFQAMVVVVLLSHCLTLNATFRV